MKATQQISYQEFTKLPIKEIVISDRIGLSLFVKTPMQNEVIEYKNISRPFFGADNSYDKPTEEIINKLIDLERDSKDFLLERWIANNN